MRLFVGLAISEAVRDALERLTLRLRAKDDGLRWSTPEQWHVTLVFLGEVEDAGQAQLGGALRGVRERPLTLRMNGLGVFERVGILYAEVEATPELLRLHEEVELAARDAGLAVESRPYRAHITLARSRNREGRKTVERMRGMLAQLHLNASWSATEFLLYESRLSPGGSRYVVRERIALS